MKWARINQAKLLVDCSRMVIKGKLVHSERSANRFVEIGSVMFDEGS